MATARDRRPATAELSGNTRGLRFMQRKAEQTLQTKLVESSREESWALPQRPGDGTSTRVVAVQQDNQRWDPCYIRRSFASYSLVSGARLVCLVAL
eukprot:SAG31_NODE_3019_length_4784_cov_2.199360_1_plen_95_part_10